MAKCLEFLSINLENIREGAGLNQKEFAEMVGVSPSYLSQLLSQSNDNPSYDILEGIAAKLGTSVPALLNNPREPWGRAPTVAEIMEIIQEALLTRNECQATKFIEIIHVAQTRSPFTTYVRREDEIP